MESQAERAKRARELYESGANIVDVAAELGVAYGTARKLIIAGGATLRPRGKRRQGFTPSDET